MSIKIKCQCGKDLVVKDQFAGKTVKCPACSKPLRIPAAGASPTATQTRPTVAQPARAQPATAQPATAQPAPMAQTPGAMAIGNPMSDLFDQEGFGTNIAAVCPACGAEMAAEAVLCTKCGFNKATGEKIQGHMTPGVDISSGNLALEKAAKDMARADRLQQDMTNRAGMPPWMLALILFILASATGLATMAVMSATRIDGKGTFNAMQVFLQLSGGACAMVAIGAYFKLAVEGFRENRNTGFLCLTVVYLFYFVFQKPKGRLGPMLVLLIIGGAAAGLLIKSQSV